MLFSLQYINSCHAIIHLFQAEIFSFLQILSSSCLFPTNVILFVLTGGFRNSLLSLPPVDDGPVRRVCDQRSSRTFRTRPEEHRASAQSAGDQENLAQEAVRQGVTERSPVRR